MAERRQVPRYLCDLKAELLQPGGGRALPITVVTLSVKGVCVEGKENLERGQKYQLKVDWQGKNLQTGVEAIWLDQKGRAGLKFLPMQKEVHSALRELCSTLKLQPLRGPGPVKR